MKRWYEQDATLKQSIDLLQVFPDDILTVIAEGFNQVAEKEFKAKELMRSYKTLGQEKVLALYKSKRKQRNYDKNPMMTTLVNYFLLLPAEHRTILAGQVIELVGMVQTYLDECETLKLKADVDHIRAFRNEYLTSGDKAARTKLDVIRAELQESVKEATLVRNFNESDSGLKLNFTRSK
jgi:hypothetical protein